MNEDTVDARRLPASTALAKSPQLPEAVARRGLDEFDWRALQTIYPGANPASILLLVDYCKARRLDPLKKPAHIVSMEVRDAKTNLKEFRDVILPGIYEQRATAQRTGLYLGHSKPVYGPVVKFKNVSVPEYCEMTMYRWNGNAGRVVEFPVRCDFAEVVATKGDGHPNSRWSRAPKQMLTKCTEAAGLREAFPDEIGGEHTAEELEGQRAIDVAVTEPEAPERPELPMPEGFEDWLLDLTAAADEGWPALEKAWEDSLPERRAYLTASDPGKYESLKAKAEGVGVS